MVRNRIVILDAFWSETVFLSSSEEQKPHAWQDIVYMGRLFDDGVVVVEYVPFDIYLARFRK
jgi:hypothetical protein